MKSFSASRIAIATVTSIAFYACGGSDAPSGGGGDHGGTTTSLTGNLWHTNYAVDFYSGTSVSSLDGEPTRKVTGANAVSPWIDGSQYTIADYETLVQTTVSVYDAAGGYQFGAVFENYVSDVRPSPVDKQTVLLTWGDDTVSPNSFTFADLEEAVLVDQLEYAGAVDWLPDGTYLHVYTSGEITTAALGEPETVVGEIAYPAGWRLGDVFVSPRGDRMALWLVEPNDAGSIDASDVWVADIDGTNLHRFSESKIGFNPHWSLDGSLLAVEFDTGAICGYGTCLGSCDLKYANADDIDVTGLDAADDATGFEVLDGDGDSTSLGCGLLAWTR